MIRTLLSRLFPKRIITDRTGKYPYLIRWYIIGRRYAKLPFQVLLHKFCQSDDATELHSHPWKWSIAIIIKGGYVEERRERNTKMVSSRVFKPISFNVIKQNDYHRVELLGKVSWSIFIAGPRTDTWYFWNRGTGLTERWDRFLERT